MGDHTAFFSVIFITELPNILHLTYQFKLVDHDNWTHAKISKENEYISKGNYLILYVFTSHYKQGLPVFTSHHKQGPLLNKRICSFSCVLAPFRYFIFRATWKCNTCSTGKSNHTKNLKNSYQIICYNALLLLHQQPVQLFWIAAFLPIIS